MLPPTCRPALVSYVPQPPEADEKWTTFSVSVAPECISTFNELKLGKGAIKIKFIIYKMTDDYKQIVVEETSEDPDWEVFRNKLLSAKTLNKGKEDVGPRYAVYDFEYELAAGEGKRFVSPPMVRKGHQVLRPPQE